MRLLALLLVPAFIGLVTSQQQDHNYGDAATFAGGSSRSKGTLPPLGAPNAGPMQGNGHHGFAGQMQGNGPMQGNGHHTNVGSPPVGGSSRQSTYDFAPAVPGFVQGSVQGVVHHSNAGAAPQGGSSRGATLPPPDAPLGPVVDRVNMVNAGANPVGGNQNSGEVFYGNYGGGVANNHPDAAGRGNPRGNQVYGTNHAGGSSGGNGGPAYAAGTYSDGTGQAAPLGGAAINDLTQQEAGKAQHVHGAASVGATIGGVVIAVLVLVGIVGVAAVFLVRQRQSRMTIASV